MDNLHAVYLALLQGFTEFLPISSSAHLILLPRLAGWQDQGLAFDVSVHVGTLFAVLAYFRHDILRLLGAWLESCRFRPVTADARLVWFVILGSVPLAVAGLLLHDYVETFLRSPLVIAATTIGFGVVLGIADLRGSRRRAEESLKFSDAVWIGLSQVLALVPGTSRSGITMTAALMLGLTRSASARFSFLLSIPAILMAGGYESLKLFEQTTPVDWQALLLGTVVAFFSAFLCIRLFMLLIERVGMLPFAAYRLVLGIFLLLLFY